MKLATVFKLALAAIPFGLIALNGAAMVVFMFGLAFLMESRRQGLI